jgi:signal transduction histidine kinase
VDPNARYCDNCRANLAIAAALAEQRLIPTASTIPAAYLSPEVLVPRLGEYLQDKGVLKAADLQHALTYQEQLATQGQPRLLGQVLIELGLANRETIDLAITEQIFQLQSALEQANRQLEQHVQHRTTELQAALNRLTELSQLKSNFISNISHELRTPLTHIIGYIELLLDGSLGSLEQKQVQALEVVSKAGDRLEKIIDDLIQFSAAAKGELSLHMQVMDVALLIHTVVERLSQKAIDKQLGLKVALDGSCYTVRGDAEKLEWVLIELLNNAIKYTLDGGKIKISAHENRGLVSISVEDTGIGISEEKRSELFLPFHQLDGSSTRRFGGTGLGLALVKQIIEAHGSHINVSSEVGKGTQFEFSLVIENNTG